MRSCRENSLPLSAVTVMPSRFRSQSLIYSGLHSCRSQVSTRRHRQVEVRGWRLTVRRANIKHWACLGLYPRKPRLRLTSRLTVALSTPITFATSDWSCPAFIRAYIW